MKKTIAVMMALLMLTSVMTACGSDKKATKDTAAKETVFETTPENPKAAKGVIEHKDAEGNVIEIDENGKIVSVKDKDGNTVSVSDYLETHEFITEDNDKDTGDDDSSSAPGQSGGSSSGSGSSGSSSSAGQGASSASSEEGASSAADSQDNPPGEDVGFEPEEYELPII